MMPILESQRRMLSAGFCSFVVCIAAAGMPELGRAGSQETQIQVEKKPKYIPAGGGQEPFNVTRHLIRLGDIQSGGPPKDGIPALTDPAFMPAAEANRLLRPGDIVLGVEFDGVAKAYPVRILNWHEIVNDEVGPQPVLVSW